MKKIILVILLIFSNYHLFSQDQQIDIRFIANCGLHITDGELDLYIDFPYKSGAHKYMEFDRSEIDNIQENAYFLFTHKHADHYSKKNMKTVLKKKKGQCFGPWNIDEFVQLSGDIPGFSIQVFKTKHSFSFNHHSYLIDLHGKQLFISGDTETADLIATMKNLDWAFIPAWLAKDAHEKNIKIDAANIGIYHIGPRDNINITGDKIRMFTTQGETVTLPY